MHWVSKQTDAGLSHSVASTHSFDFYLHRVRERRKNRKDRIRRYSTNGHSLFTTSSIHSQLRFDSDGIHVSMAIGLLVLRANTGSVTFVYGEGKRMK